MHAVLWSCCQWEQPKDWQYSQDCTSCTSHCIPRSPPAPLSPCGLYPQSSDMRSFLLSKPAVHTWAYERRSWCRSFRKHAAAGFLCTSNAPPMTSGMRACRFSTLIPFRCVSWNFTEVCKQSVWLDHFLTDQALKGSSLSVDIWVCRFGSVDQKEFIIVTICVRSLNTCWGWNKAAWQYNC